MLMSCELALGRRKLLEWRRQEQELHTLVGRVIVNGEN